MIWHFSFPNLKRICQCAKYSKEAKELRIRKIICFSCALTVILKHCPCSSILIKLKLFSRFNRKVNFYLSFMNILYLNWLILIYHNIWYMNQESLKYCKLRISPIMQTRTYRAKYFWFVLTWSSKHAIISKFIGSRKLW